VQPPQTGIHPQSISQDVAVAFLSVIAPIMILVDDRIYVRESLSHVSSAHVLSRRLRASGNANS
jgi:hypothetical protein